jgi:hypothetical protein
MATSQQTAMKSIVVTGCPGTRVTASASRLRKMKIQHAVKPKKIESTETT